MRRTFPLLLVLAFFATACNEQAADIQIAPTPAVPATVSETFPGTLAPAGFVAFNFTVGTAPGSVSVTLATVAPTSTIQVGLGLGTPSGASCVTQSNATVTASASTTPQLSGTATVAGTLCIAVFDRGGDLALVDPVDFTVIVAHP